MLILGMWIGKDESEPFLLLDIEGTDSKKYWGEKFLLKEF